MDVKNKLYPDEGQINIETVVPGESPLTAE